MIIKYDRERLSHIANDISALTNISISILDTEYNILTNSLPEHNYCSLLQTISGESMLCNQCDRQLLESCRISKARENHICRAGLYDCAMPIIKHDVVVAYVLMGQIRSVNSPDVPAYVPNADAQMLTHLNVLYSHLPFLSKKRLDALYDLLPHILFSGAINIVYDPFFNEITQYINENLQIPMSINHLCARFHLSKNMLYEIFRKNLDTTVNEYIIEQRLKLACELLFTSSLPVCKIAENAGFYNYPYFCRLFKSRCRLTPSEYRKHI